MVPCNISGAPMMLHCDLGGCQEVSNRVNFGAVREIAAFAKCAADPESLAADELCEALAR